MATADALIASLSASIPNHTHNVTDSDTYFIIDPITRHIANTASAKNVLMQYDHNSERFTFETPRYVEGHDMTKCTSVKIHYNNIDTETEIENPDVYESTDLRIDPNNPDNVICSWLISRNATQLAGVLSFIVQYLCADEDGNVVYEWHSDIYSDIEIKPGRNNGDPSVSDYTDILEQWRAQLFGEKDSMVSAIQAETQVQLAEIQAKGAETLATIPEDYTTTHEMADEALRKKANAVILSESGESPIFLDDTSNSYLLGLNLYGKTTQVTTTGKNLFQATATTKTVNGITFTVNEDGSVTLFGTASATTYFEVGKFTLPSGEYILSGCDNGSGTTCLLYFQKVSDSSGYIQVTKGDKIFTVNDNDERAMLIAAYVGATFNCVTLRPMIRLTTVTDSTYEPYSGGYTSPSPDWSQPLKSIENPTVEMYGKNLLLDSKMIKTHTQGGITCDYEGNGIFHIHGTYTHVANSIQLSTCYPNIPIDPNRKYTLHGKLLEGSIPGTYHPYVGLGSDTAATKNWMPLYMNNENMSIGETIIYSGIPKDTLADATHIARFWIYHYNPDMTSYTADFRIQVWLTADDGSEFQPSDEKQTISLQRTIHGVATSQNGNYTDSNGQQWICDEIDFERGKFIQRVQSLSFDGTESWSLNDYHGVKYTLLSLNPAGVKNGVQLDMCTHAVRSAWVSVNNLKGNDFFVNPHAFFSVTQNGVTHTDVASWKAYLAEQNELGNPVTILYALGTPIEHDLTSTELQAFRALTTNATDTSFFNDQNARMSVKYVADLARYIHKNVTVKEVAFDLTLKEANWVPSPDSRYFTQVIDYKPRSTGRISLNPSAAQQVSLILDGIAMFVANENGVATAYCISSTPGKDITIPASEQVVVFE